MKKVSQNPHNLNLFYHSILFLIEFLAPFWAFQLTLFKLFFPKFETCLDPPRFASSHRSTFWGPHPSTLRPSFASNFGWFRPIAPRGFRPSAMCGSRPSFFRFLAPECWNFPCHFSRSWKLCWGAGNFWFLRPVCSEIGRFGVLEIDRNFGRLAWISKSLGPYRSFRWEPATDFWGFHAVLRCHRGIPWGFCQNFIFKKDL